MIRDLIIRGCLGVLGCLAILVGALLAVEHWFWTKRNK